MKQPPDNRLRLGPNPSHSPEHREKLAVEGVSFWYGAKQALKDVSVEIFANEVTAFLGPSGCGKSTLLRCLNRTNDLIAGARMEGRILLDGIDIYDPGLDPPLVRQRFGWIAQRPNPFPWSIRSNILYGAALKGMAGDSAKADELVEASLRAAGLWDEVRDRLDAPGTELSLGQQQRLCLARAIAASPEVLLMDEPCSALDPVTTAHVEALIEELRPRYTIVIITHNIQQAARISQRVAFFHLGELIEAGDTREVFLRPRTRRCEDFITGRYG